MRKEFVILAPHPDDELIGCYKFLKNDLVKRVYYFFDCTPARQEEALKCAKMYGFEPIFTTISDFAMEKIEDHYTILAPNINDNHPHHKMVNYTAKRRSNRKMYYSVDMNVPFEILSKYDSKTKKSHLEVIYMTQPYAYTTEKFYLFESILPTDTRTWAIVKLRKEGFHNYPNAPPSVAFLKNVHRHMFHIKVKIEQFHDDRDIEYIMFKRWLNAEINLKENEQLSKSCEMIAKDILDKINKNYIGRAVIVKVMEDGENGAEVSFGV
jgi:hypothetical protein